MKTFWQKFIAVVILIALPSSLMACPCGCGSLSPMSLSPNETYKYQFSASNQLNMRNFDYQNQRVSNVDSPDAIYNLNLAMARAVNSSTAITIQIPIEMNQSYNSNQSDASIADPTLGIRYLAFNNEEGIGPIPSIAIQTSIKMALAKSPFDEVKKPDTIDVHSNGHYEIGLGCEALWQIGDHVELLLGQNFIHRVERQQEFGPRLRTIAPGLSWQTQTQLAYTWIGTGQVGVGTQHTITGREKRDDRLIDETKKALHSFTMNAGIRVGVMQNITLSYQTPIAFVKQSGLQRDQVSLSFTKASHF